MEKRTTRKLEVPFKELKELLEKTSGEKLIDHACKVDISWSNAETSFLVWPIVEDAP